MELGVTPYEAIKAYTANGAYGVFSEDRFGSIEVGKLADLVVFSDNPLTMNKERIWDAGQNTQADLFTDYTIVGGKVEYIRK
ncbi:amidohydrolase family protein [Thermodesulfobacteriota bacterium]